MLEVVRIAHIVAKSKIPNVKIYLLVLIFSFKVKNAPNAKGIKQIKFIANVEGSSAIEQILLTLLLICP